MASLLSFLTGAERQLNPFDNGATYANPHPVPQAPVAPRPQLGPPMTNNSPIQLGQRPIYNPNSAVARPGLPYQTPGIVTNIVRPALRTIPEAATTVLHPFSQNTYHPGSGIEKALFGKTPVQNIQKNVINNFQTHANLPLPQRIGLAGLDAAGHVINDLPVAGAAAKGLKLASKPAIEAAAPVIKDLAHSRVPLLTAEEGGRNVPKGGKPVDQQIHEATVKEGGASLNLKGQSPPKNSIIYSPSKSTETVIPKGQYTPAHDAAFMKKYATELAKPGNYMGTYHDDNGNVVLDVSTAGPHSPTTIKAAHTAHQDAVWDNLHNKLMPTGQTDVNGVYSRHDTPSNIFAQHHGQDTGASPPRNSGSPKQVPKDIQQARSQVGSQPPTPPQVGLTSQQAKQLGQKLTTAPQTPKLVTPPLGKKPLGVVKTVATSPQTTAPLSREIQGSYDPISNKSAMAAASQRIAQDPGAARSFAETTHSAEGNATAIQLAKQLEAEGKHDQAASLMVTKAQQALQAGQGNQIYSLWNKLSPETVAQTAAKTIEKYNQTAKSPIPQLTGEQYKAFVDQAKAIQGMAEGSREKGMATQNLLKDIGKLVPSKGGDKAFALYRTGLLTGFRTPGKVLVSHGVSSVAEQVKNLPAKVADTAIGLARAPFTGSYQRGLSVTGRGNLHGFNVGTRGAIDNLVHGYRDPLTGGHQPDFTNDVHFGNSLAGKAANAYVQGVTRLHSSIYQPFFGAQHFNTLYDTAITTAKNQGIKGAERDSFVQKFIQDGVKASAKDQTSNRYANFSTPEGAAQRARAEAEYTTFQNKTLLSEGAAALKRTKLGQVAKYIAPFTQIPSSIASKVVDYSPVGPIKEAIIQAKNGNFDQRALSQAIGRGSTGTGIAALGYHLFNSGHITTAYPTDKKEQAQWKLEGKQANSVLVGGKWRQLGSLGPAGDVLGVGANVASGMQGNKKTPGSVSNAAIQGLVGGEQVVANSPYLQGANTFMSALSQPGTKGQKLAEGLAGGIIPTGIANIASATDPLQRQTNSIQDSVTNKIPGLRQKNLPQVDVLGNNVPRAQGALGNLLDPFYSTTAKTDPLTSEFNRLNSTYNPATPTPITKDQSINGQKVNLNPQQLTQLQQKSGQTLNQGLSQLTNLPSYQSASDQTKANTISSVTTAIRDAVKNGKPVDFGTILGTAQNNLDKTAFLQSGQQTATINGKNYHLTATGKVSTATPKKTSTTKTTTKSSTKTTTAKKASTKTTTARATTTKTATFSPTKAVAAFNKGSKGIKTASAFKVPKAPKGVKVRVAKASSSTPKLKRIAVGKLSSNYLGKKLS